MLGRDADAVLNAFECLGGILHLGRIQLDAEEGIDERKADRQKVRLARMARENLVLVAVELDEPAHEIPCRVVVSVEDVRTV